MEDFALNLKNVSKTFKIEKPKGISNIVKGAIKQNSRKTILALDNISLSVPRGEILSIIGPNGSGKTTLLRTIAGVYKPSQGSIEINGSLSPLMQLGAGFQPELNTVDNIIINGMLLGFSKNSILQKVNDIIEYAELEKFSNLKLKHFSSGMRARLAFSISMQLDPDILLVDEILSVGDKNFRKKSYETFFSLKKSNKTILHSTHNLDKLSEFSDKLLLLHKGKIVMLGNPEEVIKRYKDIKSSK